MPRLTPERLAELEAFWRSHHEGWIGSSLNQREYCEVHGLPLKRLAIGELSSNLRWRRDGRGCCTAVAALVICPVI